MGRKPLKPRPRGLHPNIYYRKRTRGGGAYHYYYIDPDTNRQRSVIVAEGEQRDPEVIAKANEGAATKAKELREKGHVLTPSSITVPEAWEEFKKRKPLKASTLDDYESIWNVYLKHAFEKFKVKQLGQRQVDAFVDALDAKVGEGTPAELRKKGLISRKRRNNVLIAAKSFLSFCHDRGYNSENLGADLKPEKFVKRPFAIPTYAKTVELLRTIDPFYRPLVETALYTGQRGGELVALEWSAVDLEDRIISVHSSYSHGAMNRSTKAGDARAIPIPDRLVKTLTEWRKTCPSETIVFPNKKGNRLSLDTFRQRTWKPAVVAIGLPNLRIHDLRHTYITWVVEESGISGYTAGAVFGHKSPSTTQFYIETRSKEHDRIRRTFNKSKEEIELEREGVSTEQLIKSMPPADGPKEKKRKPPEPHGKGIVIKRK